VRILAGLPDGEKEAAAQLAKAKNKDGWFITLDYPSYIPYYEICRQPKLRQGMPIAFGSKGFHNDDFGQTRKNIIKITKPQDERANLLV